MKHIQGILIFATMIGTIVQARDLRREISLRSGWRFEIGDNMEFAQSEYDDSDWVRARVPGAWEDDGFPGYDGYAWYRNHVKIHLSLKDKALYLKLGRIDSVDEVYINGKRIGGTGTFPPNHKTAYNENRTYPLPADLLNFGKINIIAVRVYDSNNIGGIVSGPLGIYSHSMIPLRQDLTGDWKFSPGDDLSWAGPDYNDRQWDVVTVPDTWENQDYPFLDGFAWYRKSVDFSNSLQKEKCILVLGIIDDVDEVYLNGKRIGRTGAEPGDSRGYSDHKSWTEERYYLIPPKLILWNQPNILAVRIFDYRGQGGIYQGPVGIATQTDYRKFKNKETSFGKVIREILDEWN